MSNLYLKGIHPNLQPACAEFIRLCEAHDVPYIIVEDSPSKQVFRVDSPKVQKAILEYAEANNTPIDIEGSDISIMAGNNKPQKCYVAVIDDDVQRKMMEAIIHYMGNRHGQMINESFKDLEVPTRMLDTEALWETHQNHPHWAELGDRQNMYVDLQADFPPLVTDSVIQDPIKHSGVLVDGFRRLYRSHTLREPKVEAMDIADIIKEYQNRLEQNMNEDKHQPIIKQRKYSKTMEECYQGDIGKLSGDLLAHDNKTVIPAGAVVRVVDGDEGLPDIWYDGRIINVDRAKLEQVWKPTNFANQLSTILMSEDESKTKIAPEGSELEDKISSALGGTISIVEPDILFTIQPKRNGSA